MMRTVVTSALLAIPIFTAGGLRAEDGGAPALLGTTVVGRAPDSATIAFAAGRDAGVTPGDRFWIWDDTSPTGMGEIYFVTDEQCVGRRVGPDSGITVGQATVVLRQSAASELRGRLPPGVTVRGKISRAAPERRTAYLDIGRLAGLRWQDDVLVRRNDIPIARGRVELLEDDVALVSLQLLVDNAWPGPGDAVELWPEPAARRETRLNSAVLDVRPGDYGPLVIIVGTAADGLSEGRLLDLYHDGKYVGAASIVETSDPLSAASLIESASPARPQAGDLAMLRARPGEPLPALSAAVFRVDLGEGYCLIAAGESDGVRVGEKFVVRRPDPAHPGGRREIAELTVTTVKVDFAGANFRPVVADGTRVKQWDMAQRRVAVQSQWSRIGTIEAVDKTSRLLVARITQQTIIRPGRLIRWSSKGGGRPGAAIVLRRLPNRLVLHVPRGWGNIDRASAATIEAPSLPPVRSVR